MVALAIRGVRGVYIPEKKAGVDLSRKRSDNFHPRGCGVLKSVPSVVDPVRNT